MFKEGKPSEEINPNEMNDEGVFDMSGLMEKEIASEDPILAETLEVIEKTEDPRLKNLLRKIADERINKFLGPKYKVDPENTTLH